MKKAISGFISILLICSCEKKQKSIQVQQTRRTLMVDTIPNLTNAIPPNRELLNPNDTFPFQNQGKTYVLKVIRNDQKTEVSFVIDKQLNQTWKRILKEPNFQLNQSSLFVQDANKDGYFDIIWRKRFQYHTYLFNPKIENFVEIGEYGGENGDGKVDTLAENGKIIYYKNKFPFLFYACEDKPFDYHSELFVINENYQKMAFAMMDNYDTKSLHDDSVKIHCFTHPFKGKYGEYNIWSTGKTIEKFEVQKQSFFSDRFFFRNYWLQNYKKYLSYGEFFKARHQKKLIYYN